MHHYLPAFFAVLAASTVQASIDVVPGATWTAVTGLAIPLTSNLILT